jgi:beta-glucanase (GH16 family)
MQKPLMKYAPIFIIACALIGGSASAHTGEKLSRNGLKQTFADEFTSFSWYEQDASGIKGGGTWRTNLGYDWVESDHIKNRTQLANKEEQLYVDEGFAGTRKQALGLNPFSIRKDGVLFITASEKPNLSKVLSGYRYISGMISSQSSFTQQYGVFEMRAKLPKGQGLWPAFWLLPASKAWPPEIDIMEVLGHEPNVLYTTLHSNATGTHTKSDIPAHNVSGTADGFHTYAVDWGPKEIIFYFDNKEIARRPTPDDMHQPFYILANLAVGGS